MSRSELHVNCAQCGTRQQLPMKFLRDDNVKPLLCAEIPPYWSVTDDNKGLLCAACAPAASPVPQRAELEAECAVLRAALQKLCTWAGAPGEAAALVEWKKTVEQVRGALSGTAGKALLAEVETLRNLVCRHDAARGD